MTMCSYVPRDPCTGTTQTRTFGYTGLDMTSATNPENGTVTYTYDTAHHVLSRTDAIGQQTTYSWDMYGRLTAQYFYLRYSGTPDPKQTVLYYYNTHPYQPTYSNNAQGRLTAVQMNTYMRYEYNYTPSGRVQDQRLWVGGHFYDASYTWDQEGRMSSLQWPSEVSPSTGPLYQYQFDAMGRVSTMLDSSSGSTLATATYTVANELLGLTFFGITESREYNSRLQLTKQAYPGLTVLHYNYTAGANYGQISSSSDSALVELVNYTYDSLSHLSNAAVSGGWTQAYSYDGFGNLTSKSAVGPYTKYSASFDAANHQVGVGYDANGNQTSNGTYDVSNRLVTNASGDLYAYDYRGKRIVKWVAGGNTELYFYGIDGKKLTTLTCYSNLLTCFNPQYNVYFTGKLVQSGSATVVTDRTGSVRGSMTNNTWTKSAYYPYGEEGTITPDDREKFGTYMRDNPGQDYADQRYYGVGTGRFWSPDPFRGSIPVWGSPVLRGSTS
jgi:YD repeat-containing protein